MIRLSFQHQSCLVCLSSVKKTQSCSWSVICRVIECNSLDTHYPCFMMSYNIDRFPPRAPFHTVKNRTLYWVDISMSDCSNSWQLFSESWNITFLLIQCDISPFHKQLPTIWTIGHRYIYLIQHSVFRVHHGHHCIHWPYASCHIHTLKKRIIEWIRRFLAHGAAK